MLSEDYIFRLIRQATGALARILGLTKAGQFQEALQVIDQTLEGLAGLSAGLVKAMDDKSLLNLLTSRERLDIERLAVIADLFKAEGDVLVAQNRSMYGAESHARALALYLEVALDEHAAPDAELIAKVEALYQQLANVQLPPETVLRLQDFHARFPESDGAVSDEGS